MHYFVLVYHIKPNQNTDIFSCIMTKWHNKGYEYLFKALWKQGLRFCDEALLERQVSADSYWEIVLSRTSATDTYKENETCFICRQKEWPLTLLNITWCEGAVSSYPLWYCGPTCRPALLISPCHLEGNFTVSLPPCLISIPLTLTGKEQCVCVCDISPKHKRVNTTED